MIEALSFIATELHQAIGPLANPAAPAETKNGALAKIHGRLGRLERMLADAPFLTGDDFTIADAYGFAILGSLQHFGVPLGDFPQVGAFQGRVAQRPATVAMLRAEGLIP